MSIVSRTFFADVVSGTTVQLRRDIQTNAMPDALPGVMPHQINIVLEGTAEATFWAANCTKYDVVITRRT